MTIKDVNDKFAKKFVNRINIYQLSLKLLENSLTCINSCFMSLYNIDLNIASKLAKELLKEENIDLFLGKIENEKRMFAVSFFMLYISIGNIESAKKLVGNTDINALIKKVTTPEDVDFIILYLMTTSLSMVKLASKKFKEIDIATFRRYVIAKLVDKDLSSINRLLLCIAIADKKLASESVTETFLDLASKSLEKEVLRNIWFYILILAFIDKNVARNSIEKMSTEEIIQKFEHADSIYSILDYIDTIAYIDCKMAMNLYITTIAYAKTTIAQELISAIGLDESILDINAYLTSYFNTSAIITENDNKIMNVFGYALIKESISGWKFNLRKSN